MKALLFHPRAALRLAVLFGLLVCVLISSHRFEARAADSPFEIHAVLSLTGQNAYLGNEELQVFHVVEGLVNKDGGIRGRPIKFVVSDDQTNPEVAVQLASALVAKQVPVMLGFGISATCRAVIPLVSNGPVTFCFTPAVQLPASSYVFGSTVAISDTVGIGVRYFHENKLNRVAFIKANDATGQVVESAFNSAASDLASKGVSTVDRETFGVTDVSVSAQVARLKAANPQAIYSSATGTPFGTLLHGLHDAGVDVPLYTNNSNTTLDQMAQYKDILPTRVCSSGMIGMTPGSVGPGPVRDAQTKFYNAFKAAHIEPTAGHNLSWDATLIVVDAFRKLGLDASASQLRSFISGLHGWVGINGVYDFRAGTQRGVAQNGVVIICWDPAHKTFVAASRPGGLLK